MLLYKFSTTIMAFGFPLSCRILGIFAILAYTKLNYVIFVEANVTILADIARNENEDVRFVGIADQKAFFAFHNSSGMSWLSARKACLQINMRLAEITSTNQSGVIGNLVLFEDLWKNYYWIGGRDAHDERQFVWNSSNTSISTSLIELNLSAYTPPYPEYCLTYYAGSDGAHKMKFTDCFTYWDNRLCEIPLAKLDNHFVYRLLINNELTA